MPAVVYPNGKIEKYGEHKLIEALKKRRIGAQDRESIVLRLRAELRRYPHKRIPIEKLRELVRKTTEEVTGDPPRAPEPPPPADEPAPAPTAEEPAPEPTKPPPPDDPDAPPGRFFGWDEFEASATATQHGIDNRIPDALKPAVRALCAEVLDRLRMAVGEAVMIRSGYRSKALNVAIKGAANSQHMAGEAADIKTSSILAGRRSAEWLAAVIVESGLEFDQVVWYHPTHGGHVHVSHATTRPNRGETLYRDDGGYHPRTPKR